MLRTPAEESMSEASVGFAAPVFENERPPLGTAALAAVRRPER